MPAMNRTQRLHLLQLLRKKADAACDKIKIPEVKDKYDLEDLPVRQFLALVKAEKIVERPADADGDNNWYDLQDKLIHVDDLAAYNRRIAAEVQYDNLREKLLAEIDEIEDRLIFQDVSGVKDILAGFEATIKRLTSSK